MPPIEPHAKLDAPLRACPFPTPLSLPRPVTGKSGDETEKGPVVIDDDWVVRKLAQIRRRSRNVDSAISLSGVHVSKEPTKTPATSTTSSSADPSTQASGNVPVQIGGLLTLQPLHTRETTGGGDSLHAEHNDNRLSLSLSPLPRLGEGAAGFFPPAPKTSGGECQTRTHDIGSKDGAVGQEGSGATPTSSSDLSDEIKSWRGDEVATRAVGGDGDPVVGENGRGKPSGGTVGEGLRPVGTQRASREKDEEDQHQRLRDVTPEERALSLPSSSVLAADGSGELGLVDRSARWGGGQHGTGKEKNEGGTVWSKRWVLGGAVGSDRSKPPGCWRSQLAAGVESSVQK